MEQHIDDRPVEPDYKVVIESLYNEIIDNMLRYHPSRDFSRVKSAFELASHAHNGQMRRTGEPYIIHPLNVALILTELRLDTESIIAGLLHDVIEDTCYGYSKIGEMFGPEVANIVDGVTKLDKAEKITRKPDNKDEKASKLLRAENQAQNLRKMFISMTDDIRVILVKIADRLHNMRTMAAMPKPKQKEKAQETLDIYSPLAQRLGINMIRVELENLSLKYIEPEKYEDLAKRIDLKQAERTDFMASITGDIRVNLQHHGIEAKVDGRCKHYFSVYKKMQRQNKTFEQIFDLMAVRILVHENTHCYSVLGFIHDWYKPMPGRFKDYIANPKSNGYQSLHTSIIGPDEIPVEVQIRTWDMHRVSEYGIAAHWRYKGTASGKGTADSPEDEKLEWLKRLMDMQKETSNNTEYLETVKDELNVFADKIYCLTPKGHVVNLLRGSTPIDFAYSIHSAVGNKMTGAKVNGAIVRFDYELQNSDMVEILTSQNAKGPSPDWLKLVKTGQARSKINQWFRVENKEENIAKGTELLEKSAIAKGYKLRDLLTPNHKKFVTGKFNLADWNTVLASIGRRAIKEGRVVSLILDEIEKEKAKLTPPAIQIAPEQPITNNIERAKTSVISVRGVTDLGVRFSQCCGPVPGDEIVGFITRGRGISIHRTDCTNITHMLEIERQRLIEAAWELPEQQISGVTYSASLHLYCENRQGIMNDVSYVVANMQLNMTYFSGRVVKNDAVIALTVEIVSRKQLDKITTEFRKVPGVFKIERSAI